MIFLYVGCAFVTMATRQCSVNAIRLLNQSRTLEVSSGFLHYVCLY